MKITVRRLKEILQEEIDLHKKLQEAHCGKRDDDDEYEIDDEDVEQDKEKESVIEELKQILAQWEEKEYDSDEDRWQEYYKDIEKLVDKHEGKEEHDCEDHPDMSHEEWEAKQEDENEEEKSDPDPKEDKKKKKAFPYESRELEEKVYQQLLKALG